MSNSNDEIKPVNCDELYSESFKLARCSHFGCLKTKDYIAKEILASVSEERKKKVSNYSDGIIFNVLFRNHVISHGGKAYWGNKQKPRKIKALQNFEKKIIQDLGLECSD